MGVKTYEGKRSIDGLVVTVDGRPLPEHYEVKRFTSWGFEWTYEGREPAAAGARHPLRPPGRQGRGPSGFPRLS